MNLYNAFFTPYEGATIHWQLSAGQAIFVIVDGIKANEAGTFTLSVEALCMPDCVGKN